MNDSLRQALYLIADEMRGMATLANHYGRSPYVVEHGHNLMRLAARLAALLDTAHDEDETLSAFTNPDLWHASPAMGADALVFNARDEVLLIRRRDDGTWALPGGANEIGATPAETALKELWEEAGLRGRVIRLLGVFDSRRWGSLSPIHFMGFVFEVACHSDQPRPGLETIDVRYFPVDALPLDNMHPFHMTRVPKVLALRQTGACYFDAADASDMDLTDFQRPE